MKKPEAKHYWIAGICVSTILGGFIGAEIASSPTPQAEFRAAVGTVAFNGLLTHNQVNLGNFAIRSLAGTNAAQIQDVLQIGYASAGATDPTNPSPEIAAEVTCAADVATGHYSSDAQAAYYYAWVSMNPPTPTGTASASPESSPPPSPDIEAGKAQSACYADLVTASGKYTIRIPVGMTNHN